MRLIDADKGLRSKIQLETGCNFATADRIVESPPTAKAVPLDRIKKAREEIIKASFPEDGEYSFSKIIYLGEAVSVIDKLIAEVEGKKNE